MSMATLQAASIVFAARRYSSTIDESVASFALRNSVDMRTSPGTTLREFGLTCIWPTVPRA
jgi:hypothetical protein